MALTNNTLPAINPTRVVTFDALTLFAQAQTFTATGYLNNGGSTVQLDLGPGRVDGFMVVDLSAMDVSSGDETYKLFLMGSNDVNWGNGNVDVLAAHDWAAASSGRFVATILAASPAVPPTGESVRRHAIPFSNAMGEFVFRYVRAYLVIAGTTPSITLTSWLTYDAC